MICQWPPAQPEPNQPARAHLVNACNLLMHVHQKVAGRFRCGIEQTRWLLSLGAVVLSKGTAQLLRVLFFRALFAAVTLVLILVVFTGCATTHPSALAKSKPLDFQKDTFSFANELVWVYQYDTNGHWTTHNRDPKPTYGQHCFVLARTTRQFFLNARFDPTQPVTNEASYRRLIRRVVSSSPRKALPEGKKIVIPGYADLRSFSKDQEKLLKDTCGSGWESYFQRGHWRMIFPFSRGQQAAMAEQLLAELERNPPVVVHVVRFPQCTINHAVVIFGASQSEKGFVFQVYDPNDPAQPSVMIYDRTTRTFQMPANDYFPGGRVDVYEVYYKWDY